MAKVKIIGDYLRKVTNEDGNLEITFCIKNWNYKNSCANLEKRTYTLELAEVKSKRSIEQNRYLWALIGEINAEESGGRDDDMDIYCQLLEKANAKFEYIGALEVAEQTLRDNFRAVKRIKPIDLNGKDGYMYQCYIGSSKMNKEEMSQLIEATLDYASQIGLDITFYKDVLR